MMNEISNHTERRKGRMVTRRESTRASNKGNSRGLSTGGNMSETEARAISLWIARAMRARELRPEAIGMRRLKGKRKGKPEGVGEGKGVQFGAWSSEL